MVTPSRSLSRPRRHCRRRGRGPVSLRKSPYAATERRTPLEQFPATGDDRPALSRQDEVVPTRFAALTGRTFDVLIVGGGVIGAGIARDAALRGLRVALFEQADFGGGTTSGSTRLVHGGLRYLEMLDFALVRMDLRERETLLKIAPHLVKPLEFLVPWYGRRLFSRWRLRIGMVLYDLLSFDKSLPNHRWLSRGEVPPRSRISSATICRAPRPTTTRRSNCPSVSSREHSRRARAGRACLQSYRSRRGAARRRWPRAWAQGARRDERRDRRGARHGRGECGGAVVRQRRADASNRRNAAGVKRRVRTTKGVHVACPRVIERAVVLSSPIDGRLFFAIPWLGYTWIGTTDTDFEGDPANARADAADVAYLMESVKPFLPALDAGADCVQQRRRARAGDERRRRNRRCRACTRSRMKRQSGVPGLISVLGGKITGYRAIAEEATDRVCRVLGVTRACETAAASAARRASVARRASIVARRSAPPPPPPAVLAHLHGDLRHARGGSHSSRERRSIAGRASLARESSTSPRR